MDMTAPTGPGPSPYDTWLSGGLRFLVELVAWTVGPWAAGSWLGTWAAIVAAVVLIGVPAVFSTPGDKHQVLVPTPGPVRLMIEFDLAAVAAVAAWLVWPVAAAGAVTVLVVVAQATGWRRSVWLLRGAPAPA